MIRNKKQMFIIIGVFALVMLLGTVSYAFFNYTRTGAINNLGTGRISFNTTQSNTLNITNVFPMTSSEAASANLDAVTIAITGDTTYIDGEEYLISLVDVDNTVNGKSIPLNYKATYTATSGNSVGTSSNTYWTSRHNKDASIYTLTEEGKVKEGKQILVGYIDNGATGINGTLTIKAYIDADRIAISDTYYGNVTATPVPNGPNDEYGTTDEWVNGRTVLTTSEWNSLGSTPISFKIRAESNEGIWVEEDATPNSCFLSGYGGVEYGITIFDYDASCGSDVIIPHTIPATRYLRNPNMNVNTCVNYLTSTWGEEEEGVTVDTGETYEAFCNGTGTSWGLTMQQIADDYLESRFDDPADLLNEGIFLGISVSAPVKTITSGSFSNKNLTSVEIPNTVTTIERNSFSSNSNLTSMTIDIKTIPSRFALDQGVFSTLSDLTIGNNVETIEEIAFGCLDSCNIGKLTTVKIPNNVTTIGKFAFCYHQLTSVTIGNGITSIGSSAFEKTPHLYNSGLASITIDKSCNDIKNNLLYEDTNYYPFTGPYSTGVTVYGANNEVCDAW